MVELKPHEFMAKISGEKKTSFEAYLDEEFEAIRPQLEPFLQAPVRQRYYHMFTIRNEDVDDEFLMARVVYWMDDENSGVIKKNIEAVFEYENQAEQMLDFHKRQVRGGDIRVSG